MATWKLVLMGIILLRLGVPAALMFLGTAVLLAQSSEPDNEPDAPIALIPPPIADQSSAAPSAEPGGFGGVPLVSSAPVYIPLTFRQKYLYSLGEIFGPDRLAAMAGYAVLDQMGVSPAQWGKRPASLAIRFASHFGASFLNHNIAFGVRAVDHEDPRYFRSGRGRPWTRAGHAVVHTFVVRSDRGGWMPAYSIVAGDLATPWLVRRWQPEQFQTGSALRAGAGDIGIDVGTNILKEFWPDLRRALPNWFTRNNPLLPPAGVD
jgi:hypothetical protein